MPSSPKVRSYLTGLNPAHIVGIDFRSAPFAVLDASISSTTLGLFLVISLSHRASNSSSGTADDILDTQVAEYNLFRQLKVILKLYFFLISNVTLQKAKAQVGVGRYNEVRPIYMADAYRKEGNNGPEWRTVHIGTRSASTFSARG